jgi:hypothetical protein
MGSASDVKNSLTLFDSARRFIHRFIHRRGAQNRGRPANHLEFAIDTAIEAVSSPLGKAMNPAKGTAGS